MLAVGLTGGIGAGKSAVSAQLATLGAAVVDADAVARQVVAPGTPGLEAVVAAFGREMLLSDGALDRPRLGTLVFGDDEARLRLNGIVHPLVAARTRELAAQAAGAPYLVHDVPLLVENGLAAAYHLVVVVDAPVATRLVRLQARGLPPEQAQARMAAQAGTDQRRAVADAWLDNAGSPEQLAAQVQRLHAGRLLPYAANLQGAVVPPRGPVRLVAPDPGWPAAGARLCGRLRHVCGDLAVRVEHVGSTAVPGLAAKDVVDLQVQARSWEDVETLAGPLADAGFPLRDDVHGVPPQLEPDPTQWREHLHRSADPGRAANVHVRVAGSAAARAAVALRDLLRADPCARTAYEREKIRLAARYPQDVDAYAEGRTEVLLPLLARALAG